MALINVNREVEDSFYRYKMPRIIAKVEGKGNGIKTVIPNMADVARALNRPVSYPTKYFGCELGAQVQMYPEEDRYIVNGAFDAARLQDLLDGFIKKFVLCHQCTNPETDLRVSKKGIIEQSCIACGHRLTIPLVHKLTTYIVNNPPNGDAKDDKKDASSKSSRRAAKTPDSAASPSGGGAAGVHMDKKSGDGVATAANRSNIAQRVQGGEIDAPKIQEKEDDGGWSVDTSEEAVRARAEALGSGVTGLTMTEDLEKSMTDRLGIFDAFVSARVAAGKFPAKEVLGEADRLDCKEKGVKVLALHLWNNAELLERIPLHKLIFQRFTVGNPKAQKYLVDSVEQIIDGHRSLLPKTAKIFKALYDGDLVEEDVFKTYKSDAKTAKKQIPRDLAAQILEKAMPFLTWLEEASDDESEEDEEDEDNVEFAADPKAAIAAAAAEAAALASAAASDEDELDIDAI